MLVFLEWRFAGTSLKCPIKYSYLHSSNLALFPAEKEAMLNFLIIAPVTEKYPPELAGLSRSHQ
jgi:hypothetical protein